MRYIRRHHCQDWYVWCEQDAENPWFDIAQGTCEAEDIPEDVKELCDNYKGAFYACAWPFELD